MEKSVTTDNRALLAKALVELKKSQARIRELEKAAQNGVQPVGEKEPVAVVGLACRFPGGADTPEKLWSLLREGCNTAIEVPESRWNIDDYYDPEPGKPGRMYTRRGYFIDDVAGFDREFFNIGPGEADAMDPQHRLLLETTWEALEYAGYDPQKLRGSNTGVFIGAMNADYSQHSIRAISQASMYTAITNGNGIGVGRLAHNFGFQGPALAVDTLCSSSLVSAHLAVRSLQNRECDLAVTGGINLLLTPSMFIVTCTANMLSADGLCKTFDDSADGYARGEGCGVLVLKRLEDARRDNDRVLAVIAGSAVNQDGPSSALPVPSGLAQEKVIRAALKDAAIDSDQVDYIEAHGTGTSLGDPLEVETLNKVFRHGNTTGAENNPLLIGSIKTNFGHTEGAAGIAGLLKIVLAMQAGEIPPHLNVKTLSRHIDWSRMGVKVATELNEWKNAERPLTAGVSAFGIGGTNAHMILQSAQEALPTLQPTASGDHLLTLSAKSDQALGDMVDDFINFLSYSEASLARICYTSNLSRTGFSTRLALIAGERTDLLQQLQALAGSPADRRPKTAVGRKISFMFTGYIGDTGLAAAQKLYRQREMFRQTFDAHSRIFSKHTGIGLGELLWEENWNRERTTDNPRYSVRTLRRIAHLLLEVAMADFWVALGVSPNAVTGLGLGEYAAACFSGVINVDVLVTLLPGLEKVAAEQAVHKDLRVVELQCDGRTAKSLLGDTTEAENSVNIIAIKSSSQIWLAGSETALRHLATKAEALKVDCRFLGVLPDTLIAPFTGADYFRELLSAKTFNRPNYRLISGTTGQLVQGEVSSADYWSRQMRNPIKLGKIVSTLAANDHNFVMQLGDNWIQAHPWASGSVPDWYWNKTDGDFTSLLATLWQGGTNINWKAFHKGTALQTLRLPTYPFQRRHHWLHYDTFGSEQAAGTDNNTQNATADSNEKNQSGEPELALDVLIRSLVASVKGMSHEDVKPEHNFQEHLGYDSMMIMELKSRLERNFKVDQKITVNDMMKITTVSELINFVGRKQAQNLEMARTNFYLIKQ